MPGSDESHFNVRLCERQSHKTVSTDHNFWRERSAEVVSLYFSLTPYRRLGQTQTPSTGQSYGSFLQPPVTGPGNCQLKSSFLLCAQTVVSQVCYKQLRLIKQGVTFIAANKVYTSTNKTTIVWIETELFLFFTRGGCVSCLRACLGARLLLQSY